MYSVFVSYAYDVKATRTRVRTIETGLCRAMQPLEILFFDFFFRSMLYILSSLLLLNYTYGVLVGLVG